MIFTDFDPTSFDDFSLGLDIGVPQEIKENLLHMNVLNSDKALFIQTPRLNYEVKNDNILIKFQGKTQTKVDQFYLFIRSLETFISRLVSDHLLKLSTDIITSDLFKTSINLPDQLHKPLYLSAPKTFRAYNRKGEPIKLEDIVEASKDHFCTFILVCEHVAVTPTSAKIKWTIDQVLLHPKKTKKKSKEFGIQSDKSEEVNTPILHFRQLGIVPATPPLVTEEKPKKEEGITISLD